MAKKLQLQIPEPCHEDWEKMSACDKGRFCNSCQKTVVDFTGMSDTQLVAFFRKPSTGSLCGRFNDQQLEREIALPQKRIPWLKYMLQISLPVFFASNKAISQGAVKGEVKEKNAIETCVKPNPFNDTLRVAGRVDASYLKNRLAGRVVNENGEPVPYASVFIKDTKSGVNCDAAGYFDIKINPKDKFVTLVTSSIGYEKSEKDISINGGSMNEIVLKNNLGFLKEIVVTSYGSIRKGDVVGSFSTIKKREDSITNRIRNFFVKDSLRVYPNPAKSEGQIRIEIKRNETNEMQIELFNLQGQMINSTVVSNHAENKILTYKLPNVISGSYLLRLTNKKSGKAHTEKIIIQ